MRSPPASVVPLVALLVVTAACTSTSPPETPSRSISGSPTASTGPSEPSPVDSPGVESPSGESLTSVTITPPEDGSFLVRGSYPRVPSPCVDSEQRRLVARYPGTLWVERAGDGTLELLVTLPFEKYLEGIAEVPASWPRAALRAQAVAARSYALATTGWDGEEGEALPTPICATTACQVYRGVPVPFEPTVRRWYAAVRHTSGEVLLHDGRPAETVYFSTSNGQTYGNDEVFGSPPLPYLRPVVERDDGASSVSRWSVRLPFEDLATFLHAGGDWPRGKAISSVRLEAGTVVVEGAGATRSIDSITFRSAVNLWAPCLDPDRYPPPSSTGSPLPITIPSRWMTISSESEAAVFAGRGWGHGAGMVQWGAYGKALRGLSAPDILAFYYGGLRPQPYPEPGLIHVQVADGLTSLRIKPSGPGADLDGEVLGSGMISIGGGDTLTVTTSGDG